VAAIASFFGDQLCFYIGRRYGAALLARKPCIQAKVERVTSLLHRHHAPLILSIKFLYGLRTAGLIAIGMSNVPWPRFLAFNFLSALVWAACVGGASYVFGRTLENVFTDFSEYGTWMMGASLLFGSVWIVLSRRRQARAAAKRQADPDRR
jgi:membrane protein DedA with SNARE-associated domain